MVKNKRGRKSANTYGVSSELVRTWAMFDGQWVYQGMCKKHTVGVTEDGGYNYYTLFGTKMKQEALLSQK